MDNEDTEASESAALSKGRGDEDEEEREASESTTLYEECGIRDDFLEEAESAGLCRATGARVDFPCAGSLVGLIIVMGEGTYFATAAWSIYPTRYIPFAHASWTSDIEVVVVEGEPGEDQECRSRDTKVLVVG